MAMSLSTKATNPLFWCWFGGVHGIVVAQALSSCAVPRHSGASIGIIELVGRQTEAIDDMFTMGLGLRGGQKLAR